MAGRDADKEKARILRLLNDYVAEAKRDSSMPLTYDGIAKRVGISRGHFSKAEEDDDFAQVVRDIEVARRERAANDADVGSAPAAQNPVATSRPTLDGMKAELEAQSNDARAHHLTDDELALRIAMEVRGGVEIMTRWLTYAGSAKGRDPRETARDAALLCSDLDKAIAGLHAVHARLRPLAREHEDRLLSS